jgi:glycosyltransferase involved in cell wall biosynthesis
MSSHAEAYGMVTIEAMASGLPVIGTKNGGTPELLENGELGLLVEPKDERQLAEALGRLYADQKLRSALGVKARQVALAKYSYQTQCELIEQLLEKLIGNIHAES